MTMLRVLPYAIALLLGVGAAVLAACGESTRGGIPAAEASNLKSQLEDVRQRVADGRCAELDEQLRRVDDGIDNLARSVDARLVRSLSNGANRLRQTALEECNDNRVQTQTETEPTVTETQPPEPTTTETETTPPETTTTTPPETTTTTTPPPTLEPPPPPEPAPVPPPPVNPGGGTPSEVP
jgi:hypothetical protein